jgi:beta-glucosidase
MMKTDNFINDNYEEEVKELISKMTLREKLGQCVMIEPCFCLEELNKDSMDNEEQPYNGVMDPKFLDKLINEYHIGLFLFGGISIIGDGSPRAWADYLAKVNEHAQKTRLKIPMLFGADAVHGVNFIKSSTIYSHNLGVTATWNPELVREYAETVGNEFSSIGFNCNFAPTIDVARDQRWGRVYESLGEDSYLASIMSRSLVEGMQESGHVAATAKHFIGYGESSNGMDRTPADLSERSIIETHVPPFKAAIDSGVHAIMINGGDVNGIPMPASKKLMIGLLRKKLNFKGVTMSDWEDVHRLLSRHKVVATRKESIAKAFNAGLDMNMAVSDLKAVDIMEELVDEGVISMDRVDEAVGNILRVKHKIGLFDYRKIDVENAAKLVGNAESKRIARQLALESMTLLKNDNNLLPLSKKLKSILLTGNSADSKRHLCGGWTLGWASAKEEDLDCYTILDAIREKVSKITNVTYISDIGQFEELDIKSDDYDICISIVGEEPHSEWLGDSMGMKMEENEELMLRKAYETGIPVVMVSMIGRPQTITWENGHIPSILWAYVPGTEGAKPIADVLFGDYNPSGRLSISFPKDGNQIPVVYNARRYECHEITTKYEPLYPFGFGLSYTEFEYSDLRVPLEVHVGKGVEVTVNIKNCGQVAGSDVVQLYLKDTYASVTRPLKSLKAFSKIFLNAGEEKTVTFRLEPKELSLYDEELEFVEEKREIEIQVGNQSQKFKLI